MEYREIKPNAGASRFIKCYWLLEGDSAQTSAENDVQRIVPDGRTELIFNLGRPFASEQRGAWKTQPQSFIAGQITGPLLLRSEGRTRTLGIRFHPHGATRILGMPVRELTDAEVPLGDISPRLHQRFARLGDLSPSQGLAALDDIVDECTRDHAEDEEDSLVSAAVGAFERAGGLMSIGDVADYVGLSQRQLQRRFLDAVGILPKLFCRMQRFQRVFRAMEAPHVDWVDAAVDCGYYDQAHLIRDFREFSGKTPTTLLAEEIDLSRKFFLNHAVSHFSKTAPGSSL